MVDDKSCGRNCGKNCGRIIAIVGMCGAGKSVVTGYLRDKGFEVIYFGGLTMMELGKRGLAKNEVNEKAVREELRVTYGKAAYAVLSLPLIKEALKKGNVALDGLYSWSEYKLLKEEFGELLTVVAVTADRSVRYRRLKNRELRPLTHEEAQKRDYSEIENIEKGGPIAIADYTLLNNGSTQELFRRLDEIML